MEFDPSKNFIRKRFERTLRIQYSHKNVTVKVSKVSIRVFFIPNKAADLLVAQVEMAEME